MCHKCGKQFDLWDSQENFHIHQHCGYGTQYDGDTIELHLCCSCLEELVESCVISPIIENT